MTKKDSFVNLTLPSPGDGAYRVRLIGENAANVSSAFLTGAQDSVTLNLEPGEYTALITPLDESQPSVQKVTVSSEAASLDWLASPSQSMSSSVTLNALRPRSPRERDTPAAPAPAAEGTESSPTLTAPKPRRFAVGISATAEPGQKAKWHAARPAINSFSTDDRNLGLLVECPTHWAEMPRWRITVAVEDKSPFRAQLPLFDGGVQLFISSVETVGGSDVSLTIVPRDPARAALVKSLEVLDAGNVDKLFDWLNLHPRNGFESKGDPWTRAAAFVLLTRVGRIAEADASPSAVANDYPWFADLAIVAAWSVAATSSSSDYESECLQWLAEADCRGAPAFVASTSLATEMLRTLAASENEKVAKAATAAMREWARHARFLVRSGPFMSWERGDIALPPSRMSDDDYYVVARGTVKEGRIDHDAKERVSAPVAGPELSAPPALSLPVENADDPHKNRFGGRAKVEGFELSARFRSTFSRWVEVTCVVRKQDEQTPLGADDFVEFFLHPTFNPNRVVAKFRGNTAQFSVLAYGGFTVGAWIPSRQTELELDLSTVPGAPQAIREL